MEEPRRGLRLALAVAGPGIGVYLMAVDSLAMNVALPDLQRDLGASVSALQWVLNAYTLVIAVTVITVGRLGDVFGRRRIFVAGTLVFAAASITSATAQNEIWLIVSRAVQGVGGAVLFVLTLPLVTQLFPRSEVGRGAGIWSGAAGLGLATGPLLGGILVQAVSWRAIFIINVPLGALAVALALWTLPESREEDASRHLDVTGTVLLGAGLGALTLAIIQADAWGWTSAATLGLFAAAPVLLGLFVWAERRSPAPLVDLAIFRSRGFVGANVMAFTVFYGIYAWLFVFTLYLQNVRGRDALEAGLHFLPYPVAYFILAPRVGKLVGRLGLRVPGAVGSALFAAVLAGLAFVTAGTPTWVLVVPFLLIGVATSLTNVAISAATLSSVPEGEVGAANGIRTMSTWLGSSVGVAVAGAVLVNRGLGGAIGVAAAVTALAAVAALTTLRSRTC